MIHVVGEIRNGEVETHFALLETHLMLVFEESITHTSLPPVSGFILPSFILNYRDKRQKLH